MLSSVRPWAGLRLFCSHPQPRSRHDSPKGRNGSVISRETGIDHSVLRARPIHVDLWFAAPEVLGPEKYDKSCDMWSLGVIMYIL